MKKTILLIAIASTFVFTSCKKDPVDNPDTTPSNMEELVVPTTFDWKTTNDYQLTITGASAGIVQVTNTQGIAYQKAYLTPNQAYLMKLTVPSYEKSVHLKFMGHDVLLELNSANLSYTFQ